MTATGYTDRACDLARIVAAPHLTKGMAVTVLIPDCFILAK